MIITLLRIISALLGIVGTSFIVPLAAALACGETNAVLPFALPMAISWLCVLVFNLPFRKRTMNLTVRGTFVVVACAWIFTSLFGALPLYFSGAIPSFTDAVYESVSGFTTTGATILSDVESLPRSMNLWRCMTHWLGGMGIVALTVALLPLLGIGGFQLIKAETTGPEKGKITPKIATTAKLLWIIYFALTAIETVLLLLCRMDFIDSLSYAFATLGTGGFATRNASVGAYNSAAVDAVCTTFMFLAGVNFSLYYYALTREFAEIRHNSEFKVYLDCVCRFCADSEHKAPLRQFFDRTALFVIPDCGDYHNDGLCNYRLHAVAAVCTVFYFAAIFYRRLVRLYGRRRKSYPLGDFIQAIRK